MGRRLGPLRAGRRSQPSSNPTRWRPAPRPSTGSLLRHVPGPPHDVLEALSSRRRLGSLARSHLSLAPRSAAGLICGPPEDLLVELRKLPAHGDRPLAGRFPSVLPSRCGDSKSTKVDGSVAIRSRSSVRSLPLRGGKPAKMTVSAGSPEVTRAVVRAEGPGRASISTSASMQARTSL